MKGFLAFPALLIFLLGTPAFADLQKGWGAYEIGDYATALKEWKPLAEQGNLCAQYNLGVMYQTEPAYFTATNCYRATDWVVTPERIAGIKE